jgi:hypothetical protein
MGPGQGGPPHPLPFDFLQLLPPTPDVLEGQTSIIFPTLDPFSSSCKCLSANVTVLSLSWYPKFSVLAVTHSHGSELPELEM